MKEFVIYTQLGFVFSKVQSGIRFSNNTDNCTFESMEEASQFIQSRILERYSPLILSFGNEKGDRKAKSGYVIETDKGLVGRVNNKVVYVQTLDNAYLFEYENTARLISIVWELCKEGKESLPTKKSRLYYIAEQ